MQNLNAKKKKKKLDYELMTDSKWHLSLSVNHCNASKISSDETKGTKVIKPY